jgi:methionyl aminopeptidase
MRFAANNEAFSGMQFVVLKDKEWFERQAVAGKAVAKCLSTCHYLITDKDMTPNLSLKDLEAECEGIIAKAGCTPTFKDYKGFPGAICTSVNKQIVHGIPTDYVLQPGDVVSIDLGATFEGAIGDAAMTAIYGEPKKEEHVKLLERCQGALYAAIDAIAVGSQLGCIGDAIHKHTRNSGYALITQYGGHGIDYNMPHAQPFVANKQRRDEGIHIQPGLAIAIEPMLAIGSAKTKTLNDGWTVKTRDISCHFEHSIYVGEDKVHVMTAWEDKYAL